MNIKIFYSWQSNIDPKFNRSFILDILKKSISKVNKSQPSKTTYKDDIKELEIDQATRNTKGSPEIATTIFRKIESSQIFIADVSIVASMEKRKFPNSNVLIELGYAASKIGWENIIMIFNDSTGRIEELPFDIRGRRILFYNLHITSTAAEKKITKNNLINTFSTILSDKVMELNPIENDPIVKILVYISNRITISLNRWQELINELYKSAKETRDKENKLTREELERITSLVNPRTMKLQNAMYKDWYHYVASISAETSKRINEIFLFQDKIHFDLIEFLSKAECEISSSNLFYLDKGNIGTTDLKFLAGTIYMTRKFLWEALVKFNQLYHEQSKEYHRQYRKHYND